MSKLECGKECYTNGKGCVLSLNGICLHLFNNTEVSSYKYSNKSYFKDKNVNSQPKNKVQSYMGA